MCSLSEACVKSILQQLGRIAILVLIAGFASALLLRYSPGALADERELDPRLSQDTIAAVRAARAADLSLSAVFVLYFKRLAHGDLGYSTSHNAPITDLLKQTAPVTLRELALGLAVAWVVGMLTGAAAARFRQAIFLDAITGTTAALLLSLPASLVAYFCLSAGAAATTVLALVLWPRVFRFSRNLLIQAYELPHVDLARARGIREWRILAAHVLPSAAPQLCALAAASLSMAIGAAIPVEAICGTDGLGRLAWQAAMSRDLLLLVNLTMLIALATSAATGIVDAATTVPREAAC